MTFNYLPRAKVGTIERYVETRIDQLVLEDKVKHYELIKTATYRALRYLVIKGRYEAVLNYYPIYERIKELKGYIQKR